MASGKKACKELETRLLTHLSTAEGSLLDDEGLLDMLARTKRTHDDTVNEIRTALATQRRLSRAREEFRPMAERGAVLFFLVRPPPTAPPRP